MTAHIKPGSVVYDLGANYGIHSLLFARLAKNSGHVYAFEPIPEILTELHANVALNYFSNVTCLKLAVTDTTGSAFFARGNHVGAAHLSIGTDDLEGLLSVATICLDDFVFKHNHRPPNFIKIDVEGGESRALTGGERVLNEYRPILLVDLHSPEQDVAVGQILTQCRYDAYRTVDGSKVESLAMGWPEPDGLWGQFIAFPKD
ncbi:MAG: FkbM family methyltransferase [Pyrinomonadaceae bacterium]